MALALTLLAFAGPAAAQSAPQTLAFTPDEPFLVESVARFADGALVVSSVHRAAIYSVGSGGALTPFGEPAGQGVFGLATDAERGVIWAAVSPTPYDQAEDQPAALLQLDARTGLVLATYNPEGAGAALGDVALGPDGSVYVGDTGLRRVLRLAPGGSTLTTLAQLGERGSPQGMAVSPDGRWLVFADYGSGLRRLDLSANGASEAAVLPGPEGAELRGIDGLVRDGEAIIAIQNGTRTPRVLRLTLNADWSAVAAREALVEGEPLVEPTTGFIEGAALVFVSRSQWTEFGQDGRPTSEHPPGAVVSRLSLEP